MLEREQVLRREAEAANRAKDEFLAMLSHELRTPLNAIYGWTRILQTGSLDPAKTTQAIETIARNVRLQNALIEDLLDVSRIVSGKMRLESETLSLVSVLHSTLEAARPSAAKQSVSIASCFDPTADEMFGDKHRLQQVFNNLLANAIKFTPANGAVTVSLERLDDTAKLVFEDSGIGLAPELLPHIFDRFRQADASSKRQYGGLGLGLTIVKHLVELHGGTVSAHSKGENLGATFIVELPLTPQIIPLADVPPARNTANNGNETALLLAGARILVVDDDHDALDLMSFILEQEGADVICANSASAALQQLNGEKFGLLISDLGMAGMDGFDLIRQVRANENGDATRLPAIALTGYVSADDRERVLLAGFQTHLPKPLDIDNLLLVAVNLLKGAAGVSHREMGP